MGLYFEEFSVGDTFTTPPRTIRHEDIQAFADLTEDHNPVHVDPAFAARSIFGGVISHGPMMVGITFGLLSKLDLLDGTVIALKGIEWSFNAPVRPADSVRVRATVTQARSSRTFPDRGAVTLGIEILNQNEAVVQAGTATAILARRAPAAE